MTDSLLSPTLEVFVMLAVIGAVLVVGGGIVL